MTDLLTLTLSALIAEVMQERAADPEVCPPPLEKSSPPSCGRSQP